MVDIPVKAGNGLIKRKKRWTHRSGPALFYPAHRCERYNAATIPILI
ncbi:hypothetical protein HMPREF3293_00911 [Christensenella minuta]|uniref:Uncharacterized protein n=1 Tax=Christensenella minuta TaxID=626937 RepID=A0A136Q660_9FIRM|nr:hypothetical protein HMPREF3293_00911 [Christensenella minuta]